MKEYCQRPDFKDHDLLLESAISSYPEIAGDLYWSIIGGISYDDIVKIKYIPLPKSDFYGYQRKCLYMFKDLLRLHGKWQ